MKRRTEKWAFVTGAARRIGRAIALELASAGWNIIVHYNASHGDAVKTAKQIKTLGRKAHLAELDLADLPRVKQLIPALVRELGPIAALVNNAALFMPDRVSGSETHAKVNLEAPRILSEAFRRQARKGAIVHILDADPSAPGFSRYNANKKKLQRLTRDMAAHFAPDLRVNGVALGPILRNPRQSRQHFNRLVAKTPLGKRIAPEDVARAVRFLVETASITGAIIPLNGGASLKKKKS